MTTVLSKIRYNFVVTYIIVPSKNDFLYGVDLVIKFMLYFINAAKASFAKFCDHIKTMRQPIDDRNMSNSNIKQQIITQYPINRTFI